ncbi:MAG: phosphoribosylamine--glycine ligase [Patescibacteria group bacterium]|nr:phosphoribosylamine--glycine ligase [Patescibacteria group bacterium]
MSSGKTILVVGSGGREHALAWKLAQSLRVEKLYIAPGNGGTKLLGENVPIVATYIEKLTAFAVERRVDCVVVGPDDALALGLIDVLRAKGIPAFGPTKAAAEIEASKVFSKQFMAEAGIPTAEFKTFSDYEAAKKYLASRSAPIVVKASGLALGKGVFVCETMSEAEEALQRIMAEKMFGAAGAEVVIEEYLDGQEISLHVFSDGVSYSLFPTAQDHKPIGENDTGSNTGGMGTIAPLPWVTAEMLVEFEKRIVAPALIGMKAKGYPFAGCLYPGLKMSSGGVKTLEFNARFGDPETQSYMRLLKTDLLDIVEACIEGTLENVNIEWNPGFACCVILCSKGYPGSYEKGKEITGIEEAEKIPGVVVFHAGTKLEGEKLVTSGGRVLGVTAIGKTLKEALDKAYQAVGKIHFEGMYYRKDIGAKSLRYRP